MTLIHSRIQNLSQSTQRLTESETLGSLWFISPFLLGHWILIIGHWILKFPLPSLFFPSFAFLRVHSRLPSSPLPLFLDHWILNIGY